MSLPKPKEFNHLFVRISFILLFFILVTSTLFQNQLSEAQEGSISHLLEKGDSLYNQGKYQEAITWYDKVIAVDSNHIFALYNKGTALATLGQYQEAITWFDKVLAIDPNDVDALYNKGLSLYRTSQYQEAMTWFDKALAIDPNDADALYYKDILVNLIPS